MQVTLHKGFIIFSVFLAVAGLVTVAVRNKNVIKTAHTELKGRPSGFMDNTQNPQSKQANAEAVPFESSGHGSFSILNKGESLAEANSKVREALSLGRVVSLPTEWKVADLPMEPQPLPPKPPIK